jgi:hypothetical protein
MFSFKINSLNFPNSVFFTGTLYKSTWSETPKVYTFAKVFNKACRLGDSPKVARINLDSS